MKDIILILICYIFLSLVSWYAGKIDAQRGKLNYYIQKQGELYQITVTDENGYVASYEEETLTEVNQIINQ